MKLKLIANIEKNVDIVTIGKAGILRIRKELAEKLKIERHNKWVLALDEEDESPNNLIYFLKSEKGFAGIGKKMTLINGYFSLDVNKYLDEMKIEIPAKFEAKLFNDNKYSGFFIQVSN